MRGSQGAGGALHGGFQNRAGVRPRGTEGGGRRAACDLHAGAIREGHAHPLRRFQPSPPPAPGPSKPCCSPPSQHSRPVARQTAELTSALGVPIPQQDFVRLRQGCTGCRRMTVLKPWPCGLDNRGWQRRQSGHRWVEHVGCLPFAQQCPTHVEPVRLMWKMSLPCHMTCLPNAMRFICIAYAWITSHPAALVQHSPDA